MPFDEAGGFFYGSDALTPAEATQERFIEYVAGKLNDADGEYRGVLHADVLVTPNSEIASASFRAGSPSIAVLQGKGEAMTWRKKIGGVVYDGARHELALEIDLAAAREVAADAPPADETQADNQLAGLLTTVVQRGLADLDALGLYNIELQRDEERQRQGNARNPLRATFFSRVLYGYEPQG